MVLSYKIPPVFSIKFSTKDFVFIFWDCILPNPCSDTYILIIGTPYSTLEFFQNAHPTITT